VPSPRAHHQCGELLLQAIALPLRALVFQRAAHRFSAVHLSGDHVGPGRGKGVFEVSHEDLGPRVKGVDHHLALNRARDLHPAVVQIGWRRCHGPAALANVPGLFQKVGQRATPEALLNFPAPLQQRLTAGTEMAGEQFEKLESFRRDDLVRLRHLGGANLYSSHFIRRSKP
jgi:hypothetical protein